jgi:hypothetical protein
MRHADLLAADINAWLDRLADEGRPWIAGWIADAICVAHESGLAESEHADFWRHWAHASVRDQVRRCINKRTATADNEAAPRFPGFEHLQAYYSVKRGDEEIGVPVRDLTDQEIDEKVALLRAMGSACYAHANELEHFKSNRAGKGRAAGAA